MIDLSSNLSEIDKFEYTNLIAEQYVWTTIPILFLILGTLSNIMSILVFMRQEMRKYSSFVYFGILNIINLALIYVTILRVILEFNFKIDIRSINVFTCKIHVFLTYFLGHLSSLMICTISIDRVISVVFLNKAKVLCTPKIATISIMCLLFFSFLVSSHFLFLESAHTDENNATNLSLSKIYCEPPDGTLYYKFIDNAWKIIDLLVFAIIPFIIMSICSVCIIVRVARQSEKVKTHSRREISYLLRNTQKSEETRSEERVRKSLKIKIKTESKFSSRTRNLALMLIPVNILFLIFLSPVVMTMYFYKNLSRDKLTVAIIELLATCNYTFNFIIYFLTSSKFREELYKLLHEVSIFLCKKSNQIRRGTTNRSRN